MNTRSDTRVAVVADALAKIRRGDPHPCFCGWCKGRIDPIDLDRARALLDEIDALEGEGALSTGATS